ncbi:MAG: hypothetical protein PHD19_11510 [Dechloromonas sp.]|nr:hypothetical protein [Dechloromonas sp.]
MNKIPVSNSGASAMFVGSAMVMPGETRLFDPSELPPEYRPVAAAVAEAAQDDPLLALADLSVAKLAVGLPDLSDDELVRLEAIEQAKEKPRAGALAEIAAERLRRAEQSAPGGLSDSTGEPGDQSGDGGAGE